MIAFHSNEMNFLQLKQTCKLSSICQYCYSNYFS